MASSWQDRKQLPMSGRHIPREARRAACYRRHQCNLIYLRRVRVEHRRCTPGVQSNRYRLCSGLRPTRDSSQGAVVMHRFPRQDCAVSPE